MRTAKQCRITTARAITLIVSATCAHAHASASFDADWRGAVGPGVLTGSPAAADAAPAVDPVPAYVQAGLPIAGPRPINRFAEAVGSLLVTPRDDGRAGVQRVYVNDIAYGIRHGQIILVRLSGLMDDGRAVDVDNSAWPDVEFIDGPADFIGRQLLWGCGDADRELLVSDAAYRIDELGELRIERLRGVLEDGEQIFYEGPGPGMSARDCDVQNVNECVSDPDEPCDWGFCQGIIDCGCVGSGSCVIRVKIKCVNNSCFDPKVCRYNRDSGLCDCVGTGLACAALRQEPTPGGVACSADEGITVTENGHARMFLLEQPTRIGNVNYAVEACRDATGEGRPCQAYVNIWHAPNFPSLQGAQLLDSQQDLVPDGAQLERRSVEMSGPIAPPGPMVVEVYNHNATGYFGFWPGSNPFGQESPSFLRAPDCGIAGRWVDLAQIGFPNVHQILCFEAVQPGEPEGIPCEDVKKFKTKCNARKGKLVAKVVMTDTSHDGEQVSVRFGESGEDLTLKGKKAKFKEAGWIGEFEVELAQPEGCFEPRPVQCLSAGVKKWCRFEITGGNPTHIPKACEPEECPNRTGETHCPDSGKECTGDGDCDADPGTAIYLPCTGHPKEHCKYSAKRVTCSCS